MSYSVITIIISIIGILILFLVPYVLIRKINNNTEGKQWYRKTINLVSSILLLLSICCFVWYYAKIDAKPSITGHSSFSLVYFPDLAENNKLENNPDIVKTSTTTIPFSGSKLQISEILQTRINHVIVKKLPVKGSSIKVQSYVTKSWYKGINITDWLKVPELAITDNQLVYKYSRAVPNIEEIYFADDPTVTQFVEGSEYQGTWGFPINGSNMVYLEVPSNIAVKDAAGIAYFIK